MRQWPTIVSTSLLAVLLWSLPGVGQEVSNLLDLVPADANTLAVLRVKALTESPRGEAEGWAEQHETEFLQGAATIPPWAETFVRASYVRPGTRGGDWTVVLLPLPEGYELQQLAQREKTEVQEIGELPAVQSSRHSGYFVVFGGDSDDAHILGGMAPASRQDTARWVREVGGRSRMPVSDYLSAAAADIASQIILAIDLEDMLDPIMVRNRIDSSGVLNRASKKASLTIDFQSLRGAQLAIRTDDETTAEIRLDFGREIGEESREMRALLEEFLNDAGAAIDELKNAQTTVEDQTVTFKMSLSDESLRRVLSLITTPPPPNAAGRQAPQPPEPEKSPGGDGPDVLASRRYFNAVNRNIEDLERARTRGSSYSRTAQWHINFARRIDRLPTTGVDPALLQFGQDASSRLHALGESLRGVAVQVNALDRSIVYNVDARPTYRSGAEWWWGGAYTAYGPYTYGQPVAVDVTSNLEEVRTQQAEVVAEGEPQRNEIWTMILEDRDAIEREMVGKYGPDFQKGRRR